jgi:hypothetical protein
MKSAAGDAPVEEYLYDRFVGIVENAVSLFEGEGAINNQAKLQSTSARGEMGRVGQTKRQKNKVGNYLNRSQGADARSPPNEQRTTEGKTTKEPKPFAELEIPSNAMLEIPDDGSEVTLPGSLRKNIFGIEFFSTSTYNDVTQPELETRQIPSWLVNDVIAGREIASRGLISLETWEECPPGSLRL